MPEEPRGPRLFVNKDRTRVVPAGSPEAAFMMHEKDVKALGIKITKVEPAKVAEPVDEPVDEPEEKTQEPAANKARSKGEDK
jgi:hypothetical protein